MPTLMQWRGYYDGWAGADPSLASTGQKVPAGDFARLGTCIADWLALDGSQRVLDVGCASGTLTSHWSGRAASTVGVDFSTALVREGSARHGSAHLRLLNAEAAALPFADATFDCVVAFNVLLSLPDHGYLHRAIAEIERVARPRARVVLGSLPDRRCRSRFLAMLQAEAAWTRRVASQIKRLLWPARPRTRLLWFDVPAIAADLRQRGWTVSVHEDPPFANYREYRKTLVLARGEEVRR
jgi:SAM-dependent methyltransferase